MLWVMLALIVVYIGYSTVRRRLAARGLGRYEALRALMETGERTYTLIDVRTPAEYRAGHIPGAINIPHDRVGSKPPPAQKDSLIVLYCQSGSRSMSARAALTRIGFTDVANFGRIDKWRGNIVEGSKPGKIESN